jgi:NitT/TauT family transport system ATP-binding protein
VAVTGLEPLLQFDRVSKVFARAGQRPLVALDGVALRIQAGEFVCVVGPSGCGKSTVLRLAAGLEFATSGDVRYRGKAMAGPSRERGVVFQSYNAFPWLTVRENIGFGLDHEGEEIRQAKVERWLSLTTLSEFADSYPKALSGGMRQRLALARALVVEPELLLLDEPFGALDEPVRRTMQTTLLEITAGLGCSVLFVTHDIREAITLGDRILLMSGRPGRILEEFQVPPGKPRPVESADSAEFSALYQRVLRAFPDSSADTRRRR